MKRKYLNKEYWQDVLTLSTFLFVMELIFRLVENYALVDYASLRILLSSFMISMVLVFFIFSIPLRKDREKMYAFVLLIFSLYAWVQAGLCNFLGVYMSIGTSSQAHSVLAYLKEFLASYRIEYYMILIPFLIYIAHFFMKRKYARNHKRKLSKESKLVVGCMLVISSFLYFITLWLPFMQNNLQLVSNLDLFHKVNNPAIAVNQFGTSSFAILDISSILFPRSDNNDYAFEASTVKSKERTFDDTLWQKITDEETDPTYKTLNSYFISRSISDKNAYTGYFKGKNVIVIMMESVNNSILNKEYFPNFAHILEHSWFWENNYSPRNACATGDNEFSGMTSLYALNTSCTANTYPNNTYFESIFNEFNQSDYTTTSYHDFDETYYPRNIFHLNMGSSHFYNANELNIYTYPGVYQEWPSDVELMQKSVSIMSEKEPFMAWMTTVTPHQPYDVSSINGDKYYSLFDHTNYTPTLKRYLSKLKVTDDALGSLLEELESKSLLDDTVIVLYGDHYPYGLSDSDVQAAVTYDISDFYERERVPFVIYNPSLKPQVFEENTSYMNILPTLANLFDLNYDPRYYMGEDLMSSTYSNRIVFADSSWQDSLARYKSSDSNITYLTDETYTTEELQKINLSIYQKKEMSKLAIQSNYFDYLDKKLEEGQDD